MTYRTLDEYENQFMAAGFVSFRGQQQALVYPPGTTDDGVEYGREAVWILTSGA